jgi:DNA modification methylase
MSEVNLYLGDCLQTMKNLPDNSVDSIVTDPPYGLSFMSKKWDYEVPSKAIWEEALRVLKPGGHLLSFGGTRTYHRLVVNIEDAGFEIRDQIQWLYGSGFPKSHNIKEGDFKGFGTALKPANEPICVARKPLEKGLTVAENVQKWGTGAINIDASRIEAVDLDALQKNWDRDQSKTMETDREAYGKFGAIDLRDRAPQGRWPANIILDEVAAEILDAQSGLSKATKTKKDDGRSEQDNQVYGKGLGLRNSENSYSDSGGASRFFYVAKASKSERGEGNNHPTVKPIKLMKYLIKLVTPPGGTVLDPFLGSGTTGVAAKKLQYGFIGCELSPEYLEIAKTRIAAISDQD